MLMLEPASILTLEVSRTLPLRFQKGNPGLFPETGSILSNDPPEGADNVVTIAPDGEHTFTIANFGFTDADATDMLQSVIITSLPSAGMLTRSGVGITTTEAIFVRADIEAGLLKFVPAAGESGDSYASFEFLVSDGLLRSSGNTMTINVAYTTAPAQACTASLDTVNNTSVQATCNGHTLSVWWSGNIGDIFGVRIVGEDNLLFDDNTEHTITLSTPPGSFQRQSSARYAFPRWKCVSPASRGTISTSVDPGLSVSVSCSAAEGVDPPSTNEPPYFSEANTTRSFTKPDGPPYRSVNVGAPVVAIDPDGDVLSYTISGSPESFRIDPQTGQIATVDGVAYDVGWSPHTDRVVTARDSQFAQSINVRINIVDTEDPEPEPPTTPPTNLRVVQGDLELLVYWDTPGGQQVERFELGILAGAGTWDDSYTAGRGNYSFGNLMNGTTYTVRVRTVFVGGTSGWTTSSPVTLVAASQAPGQVTVDEIRPRPAGADLRFLRVDHATSYVIQWLTEAQWTAEMMQWTSAEEGRQQGQRTFGYTLVGLTPETPYVARIRAENAFGPGPWTEASFTSGRALPPPAPGGGGPSTSPPGAPRNLTVVAGDGKVVLSWDAPESDGGAEITDYEYRINGRNPWISTGSTLTTHTVTGLVNGTAYTFQVRAVNRVGKSFAPNQVETTPEAPEAFTLDFTHFANGNGTTSDLVFVNVGSVPVRPDIYFYDTEGNPIAAESVIDITGDLEVTEDGALTVLTDMEPLGVLTISTHGQGALVSGSVRVISDGPIGGMLRFDLPGIGEAVVGASPPVSDTIFPVRRQEGGITTGVAVHNLEEEPMEVVCELMQEGVLRDAVSLPLAANGQTAWLIDAAFPAADTSDFAGSVRCDAPGRRRFSAVALEMDPGARVFLTLPLFPVDRGGGGPEAVLDFAHFANGDGTTSDLVFVNVSTQRSRPAPTPFHSDIPPIRPAIYFYDTQGNPLAAESVVDITGDLAIQEDGGLTVQTEMEPLGVLTVSTHGRGALVSGSVKVVSDGPIGGMLRYYLPHIGEAVVGAGPPIGDAIFPVRRQEGGINTGVAIHNLESSPGLVRCELLREGVLLDTVSIPLEANGQTSWLIDTAFPNTDTSDFMGSVRCDAVGEELFSAVALEMDPGTRIFTTLPVVPLAERMPQE